MGLVPGRVSFETEPEGFVNSGLPVFQMSGSKLRYEMRLRTDQRRRLDALQLAFERPLSGVPIKTATAVCVGSNVDVTVGTNSANFPRAPIPSRAKDCQSHSRRAVSD
jgi:hypothetical protein